jgi:hypothetical protein
VPKNRFGAAWIGGNPDPSLQNANCPFNPTLYVPLEGVGLGIAVEDDAMRLQGRFGYDASEGIGTIRSDELVVSQKGGNEYTVALSIYPTSQGNYWEFINSVRRDRTPVVTMPGTIWFAYPDSLVHATAESLSQLLKTDNVAYVIFWEHLSPKGLPMPFIVRGPGQLEREAEKVMASYEETVKKAIGLLRAASKDVKVLLYATSFTCGILNEAQRAALNDSWITGQDGRPIRRHEEDKRLYPLYFVYPTEENAFGKQFARFVEHLLSLGADGIYWDEMAAATRDVQYTYSAFDGCTADVDPVTQKIQRVKGLVGLLSSAYRAGLVKRLIDAGRTVHANGAPETRAMEMLPITRMVETQDSASRTYELHLTTPYAYTWGPFTLEQFRDRLSKGGICFRSDKGAPFIARSFPITPVSLGSGSVTGREKIISSGDGAFGWAGPWEGIMTLYDRSGQAAESRKVRAEGELEIRVPPQGLAVIERIP